MNSQTHKLQNYLKNYKSLKKLGYIFIGAAALCSMEAMGQNPEGLDYARDSVEIPMEINMAEFQYDFTPSFRNFSTTELNYVQKFTYPTFNPYKIYELPDLGVKNSIFASEFDYGGELLSFENGSINTRSEQNTLIGIGLEQNLGIGVKYNFTDKLTAEVNVSYNRFADNSYRLSGIGVSGRLSYSLYDGVTANVFGSYSSSRGIYSSNMVFNTTPYYDFGASMSLDVTDRFGVEVGARGMYNSYTGGIEVAPVVMPYYKIDDVTIGFDVGGLVYSIFRGNGSSEAQWGQGPTPPIPMPRR